MRYLRYITTIMLLILQYNIVFPQAFNINVTISGMKNAELYLAYHFGSKVFVIDTVRTDENSNAVFSGEKKLDGGMYLIYLPTKEFFDIMVCDDQDMVFITDTTDLINNMKVEGSKENQIFFEFQKFLKDRQFKQSIIRNKLKSPGINQQIKEELNIEMTRLNNEVSQNWESFIKNNPGTFVAKFLKALRDVKVPDGPLNDEGQPLDPYFRYNFYVTHFFDNIDLSDSRLLKTSVINDRLEKYFARTLIQSADSILPKAISLIEKAKNSNSEVFRFIVQDILNRYAQPKIMGTDAIYVAVAELYYLSGIADWISENDLKLIKTRVKMIKPNLIGRTAPDLSLYTMSDENISLHEFEADLTILLFWDHNCGHCKTTVDSLKDISQKYESKNVKVFAVYTMDDPESWKEYVKEKGLNWTNSYDRNGDTNLRDLYDAWGNPTMFILDKKKTILAKKFDITQLEGLLDHILENLNESG